MLSGVSTICFAASYAVALALEISRLLFRSGVRGAVMLGFAGAGLVAHTAFLYYRAVDALDKPPLRCRAKRIGISWRPGGWSWSTCTSPSVHPKAPSACSCCRWRLALIGTATFLGQPDAAGPRAGLANLGGDPRRLDRAGGGRRADRIRGRTDVSRPGAAPEAQDVATRGLRLPSLEWLQRTNSRAIVVSVLMLGVGVLSGMILNLINIRNEAVRLAWNDPVVVSTWLMFFWLLAAAVLGAVYRPARQGRKVAYLTVASFVFLVIMLAAGLLMDSRHWGRGERGEGEGRGREMQSA